MKMLKPTKNILIVLILLSTSLFGQEDEGVKSPKYKDYKSDTSFSNFRHLRYDVAYAQINLLKKGALLVRLKTNNRAISKLTSAGNVEVAKNLKTETALENKIIMNAYKKGFTFCPVYFFYSESSDSVRKNNLTGIFIDSLLETNPNIVCNAAFFLVAEQGGLYNSSLGIVEESLGRKAVEQGSYAREAAVVVKNKYFIQLHEPFPYFQIKNVALDTDALDENLSNLLIAYRKVSRNSDDYKRMKAYRGIIEKFNNNLESFYEKNVGHEVTPLIKNYVY